MHKSTSTMRRIAAALRRARIAHAVNVMAAPVTSGIDLSMLSDAELSALSLEVITEQFERITRDAFARLDAAVAS